MTDFEKAKQLAIAIQRDLAAFRADTNASFDSLGRQFDGLSQRLGSTSNAITKAAVKAARDCLT